MFDGGRCCREKETGERCRRSTTQNGGELGLKQPQVQPAQTVGLGLCAGDIGSAAGVRRLSGNKSVQSGAWRGPHACLLFPGVF